MQPVFAFSSFGQDKLKIYDAVVLRDMDEKAGEGREASAGGYAEGV